MVFFINRSDVPAYAGHNSYGLSGKRLDYFGKDEGPAAKPVLPQSFGYGRR